MHYGLETADGEALIPSEFFHQTHFSIFLSSLVTEVMPKGTDWQHGFAVISFKVIAPALR